MQEPFSQMEDGSNAELLHRSQSAQSPDVAEQQRKKKKLSLRSTYVRCP